MTVEIVGSGRIITVVQLYFLHHKVFFEDISLHWDSDFLHPTQTQIFFSLCLYPKIEI